MADCNNNNPDYIVLPSEGTGTTGPAGPTGPQGPPGDVSAVPADNVTVTNDGYSTAQEIFDDLLYVLISINSFLANTTIYEIGVDFAQLGFTWAYNKTPIVAQTLTGPNDPIILGIGPRAATLDFTPNLGADHQGGGFVATETFFLTVDDDVTTGVTKLETVSFYNGVYYGDAADGVVDSAFVLLLSKNLQAGLAYSFSSTAGAGIYAWYAHKKSLGVATFTVGGFEGGFESPVTLSFTNGSGHLEDYYVYRSTNPEIGPVNIVIS
jgi:hypothetical protein